MALKYRYMDATSVTRLNRLTQELSRPTPSFPPPSEARPSNTSYTTPFLHNLNDSDDVDHSDNHIKPRRFYIPS
ncbi:hypothetical protein ColTof4_04759 [Colletotrichum tofieldiae]|nr:hypothetical protein ColTof3_10994 [Colletotrichum tofieldiae]GKT72336.1 hypothetical protein ColTof4_04759 [Colletotrichum tofieldiae]GKT89840.1 hypothetical protein Ct61P_07690 [Colletotrichum tofieldiae]